MMENLLKQTAGLFDLVDLTLCSCLYNVCKDRQFVELKGSDFVDFLNLKDVSAPIIVRDREKLRVCYLIYTVSQHLIKPSLGKMWVELMLEVTNIDEEYYNSHYKDAELKTASVASKKFVRDIKNAIEMAKTINSST